MKSTESFPTSVYYIFPIEYGERFTFHGIRGLLNQYMKTGLGLAPYQAKAYVHLFSGLVYMFPLVGAAIADSYLGKYWTIVSLNVVYLIGLVLLCISSIDGIVGKFGEFPIWSCFLPMLLIAIGSGGANPCVLSHGGDQFLPSQTKLIEKFFNIIGILINLGILTSLYSLPYIKNYVTCFGNDCYPLAYAIATVLVFITLTIFIMGYKTYEIKKVPGEFLPFKALKVLFWGFKNYSCASTNERKLKSHWMEFAAPRYSLEFINETKRVIHVLIMLAPLSFAWMLNDQYSTEWQNQYELTNQYILGIPIPVETSASIKSILVIILMPLVNFILLPNLKSRGYQISLPALMGIGYFFFILSFIISTGFEIFLKSSKCSHCLSGSFQLPQWFFLSLADAILAPSINSFAYHQVGPSFKACSLAFNLTTYSIANFLVLILEFPLQLLPNSASRQLVYIGISAVGLLIYSSLVNFYFIDIDTISRPTESKLYPKILPPFEQTLV